MSPNKSVGRNTKTGTIAGRFRPFTMPAPNVSPKGVFHRSQESRYFGLAPLRQKFDAAVRQVTDFSNNLEILSEPAGPLAEANPLYVA